MTLAGKNDVLTERVHGSGLAASDKIDVCRGLFAFLVVAAHAFDISWAIHPEARGMYPGWLHRLLLYGVGAGLNWVIGFFVISGYCIQLSVSRSVEGSSFPLFRYLAARLSRILPLYVLGLAFAVLVEWLIAPARPRYWYNGVNGTTLIAQLLFLQNLTQTFGSYAPSWSITNEMFYYIFYGLIVLSALKWGARPTLLGMWLCLVIAIPMDFLYFDAGRSRYAVSTGLLFGQGAIWFLGALVADYRGALRRSPWAKAASRFWWLLLAGACAMWVSQEVHLQVVLVVLGLAFALMLVRFVVTDEEETAAATRPTKHRRIVEMFALASYPTYLFHGPLLMLIASMIMRYGLVSDWRVTWLILVSAGLSSGIALGFLAERPTMRWRAGFLRRIARGAPSPGGTLGIRVAGAAR
jgi:peptidoglycan/LPS O-acetylase OafA/YrhL